MSEKRLPSTSSMLRAVLTVAALILFFTVFKGAPGKRNAFVGDRQAAADRYCLTV